MKVLIWVQHLLGMGHLMRAAAIARALAERGVETLLVSGGPVSSLVNPGNAAVETLPACRAADASFKILLDENDRLVTDAWWANRYARLEAVATAFDPDVILTETFPFGRKKFRTELETLIRARRARDKPLLVASSVRDILVSSDPKKELWMIESALDLFDLVLVHGDPSVIALDASFHHADRIADRLAYTGYVVSAPDIEARDDDGRNEVIVSCGSGAVGEALLETALDARVFSRATCDATWRILAGYGIANDAFGALRAAAPENVIVERSRPDFMSMLSRARISVNQGGYNTIMDVVATGVRSVVVPISAKGETEQEDRARLFAEKGLLVCLPERSLLAKTLAAAIDEAAKLSPPPHGFLTGGAARSADILIERFRGMVAGA